MTTKQFYYILRFLLEMFGRKETRGRIQWDEWSGADSWSASNVGSIESAKSPFSFFSFNLFESEEKFQVGSSNSDGSDDDNESTEEKKAQNQFFELAWPRSEAQEADRKHEKKSPIRPIKHLDVRKGDDANASSQSNFDSGLTETEPTLKGRFWRYGRNRNFSPQQNLPSYVDTSEGCISPKMSPNLQKHSQSTTRVYANPKDLIQKHLLRTKNYDFRDEIEANSSRVSGQHLREPAVHPFPGGNQRFDDREGSARNRKCFPSWPFKNRMSSDEELLVTEPELKPVVPVTSEEFRSPGSLKAAKPQVRDSIAAKISSTRKKTHSQLSRPSRFDAKIDDIWDDGTTSSGWLTLESLDGR
jgi:hypothetical protein